MAHLADGLHLCAAAMPNKNVRISRICSNCALPLHRSRLNCRKDRILTALGFYPVRCHRCCARSYVRDKGYVPASSLLAK